MVAYTSVSHMGFVLLGVYAWNQYALQGAVIVMLAHGLSTGALFVIAGALQDRMHTREMGRMGGLWDTIPRMSGSALYFSVASLGLPGLANFVGEIRRSGRRLSGQRHHGGPGNAWLYRLHHLFVVADPARFPGPKQQQLAAT